MKRIENWSGKWKMHINVKKYGYIAFNGGNKETPRYRDEEISRVNEYLYLGIPFTRDINLMSVINDRKVKAGRAHLSLKPLLTKPTYQ
ncbi:RNA-directed DNA polymerase, Retrotransposon [Trachipleistophora hominis]|uniref:RNA-directed DNA polymerase, Retrotransposon n=1 Tax=Trachipleistophora hominis TaxID=72359 RepID=L7K0L5_TRAHO|nr:RNA-directed DNA polymerase, Retrotransposon [Trachipleistophora hominis]